MDSERVNIYCGEIHEAFSNVHCKVREGLPSTIEIEKNPVIFAMPLLDILFM